MRVRKRMRLIAMIALAVAIAIIATMIYLIDRENQRRTTPLTDIPKESSVLTVQSTPRSTVAITSPTPTSSSSSSSMVSSSASPAISISPLQPVAAGAPTALRIHGEGVNIDALMGGMPASEELEPPVCSQVADPNCKNTAYWIDDARLGTAPSYPNDNTVYVLGHAWSQDDRVFNDLAERITSSGIDSLTGYTIVMESTTGSFVYTVDGTLEVQKSGISQVEGLWRPKTSNRLVLIMCALDRDFNYVMVATLTASHSL